MATVFDLFKQTDYAYVILNRGTVFGNLPKTNEVDQCIVKNLKGVFKLRKGMTISGNNMEAFGGDIPTLHAHPEDFDPKDPIVGNGVVVNGVQYEVMGITYGTNFDNGEVEHIRMSLKEVDYADV